MLYAKPGWGGVPAQQTAQEKPGAGCLTNGKHPEIAGPYRKSLAFPVRPFFVLDIALKRTYYQNMR
jgi:hypothetical protein